MAAGYSNPIPTILPVDSDPVELPLYDQPLEIIASPCYTSKLRYRSDYEKNRNRRGVLHSRNNPNYQSPAIRIPQVYLDVSQQYFIRVCLVTVENERTKCRYIHPYKLEDIHSDNYKDKANNAVWFPIQENDKDGIKSFPNLRIVKKKADDLKNLGNLRVFDSPDSPSIPLLSSVKETIKEFNLDKTQLAFTIGKKTVNNNNVTYISYAYTTIFSDEMNEIIGREPDLDMGPSESTTIRSSTTRSSTCQMYKYAPRNGFTDSNDEVLIFFTNKLRPKKYGDLQVTFEYDTMNGHWSEPVLNLEVKDQMVSFRTPRFPFPIDNCTTVNIILKQRRRVLEPLEFAYIPIAQCPQCQRSAMNNPNPHPVAQTNPNKRPFSSIYPDDEESDVIIFLPENQELNSEPETPSSSTPSYSVSLSSINPDASQQILDKLADGIASLFSNKDFIPVLRICRPFIRKRPQLLHEAINNNYSNFILTFISIAGNKLLRQKNQYGETALLQATRLNRVDIIKVILKKDNSDKLLEDVNDKNQNIFHILALNTDSDKILDLFIDHLLKRSVNIEQIFGHVDEDDHTPLQSAILSNNLFAIRRLSKYFNNDIPVPSNPIIDDVIERAVLYDDLTKVK